MNLGQRLKVRRGRCAACGLPRGGHPTLCEAHAEAAAARADKAELASNWARELVQSAGGYDVDDVILGKLVAANGGRISPDALDVVRLIAVMARDEGEQRVAKAVLTHVSAHRRAGDGHPDTVAADRLLEAIKDYL